MMIFLLTVLICTSLASGKTIKDFGKEDSGATRLFRGSFAPIKTKTIEDVPGLSEDMLVEALNEAKKETMETEAKTPQNKRLDDLTSRVITHYKRFVPELEPSRINALVMETTTRKLAKKLGLTPKDAALQLHGLEIKHHQALKRDLNLVNNYQSGIPNFNGQYRTITGINNNPTQPQAGVARTGFARVLAADYADGISIPRKAKDSSDLENARKVSSVVFKEVDRPSPKLSHMNMVWGQFVDHDIAHGAQPTDNCSSTCGLSGECFGIPVPANDVPFQSKKCIQLVRDVPVSSLSGILTTREQVNTKSSFHDASQIYGDDVTRFNELREPGTPFLVERANAANAYYKKMLSKEEKKFCRTTDKVKMPCFKSGDFRTNENQGLASMHTIWNREHNRIATELRKMNNLWSNDKVFFETRKIVGAIMQHITYYEYLPSILDDNTINLFHLKLKKSGFYYGYNTLVDASIFNSFAAAAYRFGHSQIPNMFNRFPKFYNKTPPMPSIPMNRYFDPTFLYNITHGGVDSILRGMAVDSCQKIDGFFSKAVQEELMRDPGDLSDLPALNIQRGREHGLPGYNFYRQLAGLTRVDKFADFAKDGKMAQNRIDLLKQVYKHPDDVDLFVGGISEKPVPGGIMGPTFGCLIAEQFKRLRNGDRFWYENPGVFSLAQLQEIRKSSLARIICDNSDDIRSIQRFALQKPSKYPQLWNALQPCKQLASVNLDRWRKNIYT